MKSTLPTLLTVVAALVVVPPGRASAEAGKATIENLKCGPASWHRPICPACKEGDKTYVTTKFVEAAIAEAHEGLKDLADPKKEIESMAAVVGAKHTQQKQWTEQGAKNPEMKATYCWEPVKAEQIKPLKDKSYGLGAFLSDRCRVESDRCYQFTMECRKPRDASTWSCNPHLQDFVVKDGKCDDSPTKNTCDCQPSVYWKCGLGKGAAGKGGKKRGKR
jgi:hypothetical protein